MRQLSGIDVSFLNMETREHVRPRLVAEHLRPGGAPGGAGLEATKQHHPRAHRPAGTVPPPAGRGAARPRPAVLDRGSRLRHRLPRAPPRRAAAGQPAAAGRGRQPDHRPAARPQPPAVGAVRDRRRRRRAPRSPSSPRCTTPPIDGAAGALDAGRHPRHRSRRPPDAAPATWTPDEVPRAERAAAAITARRVPPPTGEDDPRCTRAHASASWPPRRVERGMRALADLVAQPMPGPLGKLMRERLRGGASTTSTTRRRCRRRRRRARRGTRRSRRTAASPTRRSRSTTRRRSAARSAARSTTSSWRCAPARCAAT